MAVLSFKHAVIVKSGRGQIYGAITTAFLKIDNWKIGNQAARSNE